MGFLCSFLRRHFAMKPVMAARNVDWFLRILFSLGVVEHKRNTRARTPGKWGLLIVSHLFLNGETNRACSRWSDSGLWREVSEREKVRGRRGRGREKGMLTPYPTPRCFSCSHLSHFLHCPTIWTAVTRLRLTRMHHTYKSQISLFSNADAKLFTL